MIFLKLRTLSLKAALVPVRVLVMPCSLCVGAMIEELDSDASWQKLVWQDVTIIYILFLLSFHHIMDFVSNTSVFETIQFTYFLVRWSEWTPWSICCVRRTLGLSLFWSNFNSIAVGSLKDLAPLDAQTHELMMNIWKHIAWQCCLVEKERMFHMVVKVRVIPFAVITNIINATSSNNATICSRKSDKSWPGIPMDVPITQSS